MDDEARDIAKERDQYRPRAVKLRAQAASAPTAAERLELDLRAGLLEAFSEPDARLRLPDRHAIPPVIRVRRPTDPTGGQRRRAGPNASRAAAATIAGARSIATVIPIAAAGLIHHLGLYWIAMVFTLDVPAWSLDDNAIAAT